MRGILAARLDLSCENLLGVAHKLRSQQRAMMEHGLEVDFFAMDGPRVSRNLELYRDFSNWPMGRRLTTYLFFYLQLANLKGYEFAYIRYQRCDPVFLFFLYRLRHNNPGIKILIELPSYPYETEYASRREMVLGVIDRLTRGGLRNLCSRIVTFSDHDQIFGVNTVNIQNGVDLASVSLLPEPSPKPPVRLLGLANVSFWHGYDRVIEGLACSKKGDEVQFHVVGEGPELARLKTMVQQRNLAEQVQFHGALSGAALDKVLGLCHVAIGSIGMHRLASPSEDFSRRPFCPLKSREFCARGLPFAIAYHDPDFEDCSFVFSVPADDSPLDIEALSKFAAATQARSALRTYAVENLGWPTKLLPVVEFLESD